MTKTNVLMKEIEFHETKFSNREDFSYRQKHEPLWNTHWRRKFKGIYSDLKNLDSNAYILNVGAGTGPIEYFLLQTGRKFKNLISSDISQNAMTNIKTFSLNENIFLCDGTVLPFKENSFDAILFIGILHHIPKSNMDELFSEVQRVIKPNGIVICSEPIQNRIRKLVQNLFPGGWKKRHSEDERELGWDEIEYMKNNLEVDDVTLKPSGLLVDLLMNLNISFFLQQLLQYLFIIDALMEKLGFCWSYFIFIKFNKNKTLQ